MFAGYCIDLIIESSEMNHDGIKQVNLCARILGLHGYFDLKIYKLIIDFQLFSYNQIKFI